jgi:hypothetical protein
MPKLVVLDSGNLEHRAIFSYLYLYQALIEKLAKEKNIEYERAEVMLKQQIARHEVFVPMATMTYMKMIISVLKKIGITIEDKIIVAEDYGTWRKEIDSSYKAQRKDFRESKATPEFWAEKYKEFNDLIPKLNQALTWQFIKIYKIEADDIASVACRYFKDYEDKILVSTDEDWEQLCYFPGVKIFSPSKKVYKIVKNPLEVLQKKIKGDISDNLLTEPKTEAEFERRKTIVNLLQLPVNIEQSITNYFDTLPIKRMFIDRVPYASVRKELIKLYKGA